MPELNQTDLLDAKRDVDHMADLANSEAPTATDRFGRTKRTWSGIEQELSAAYAQTVTGENRIASEAAAVRAENAADAAVASVGIQVDEPTGRLTVADGHAFLVQSPDPAIAYLIYRRINAATPSTLIGVQASKQAVDDAIVAAGVLPNQLSLAGVAILTGDGSELLIAVGTDGGVGLSYDTNIQEPRVNGAPLSTVVQAGASSVVSSLGLMIYDGTDVTPSVVNSNLYIVSGNDAVTGEAIAPTAATSYPPSALEDLPVKPTRAPIEVHFALGESTSVGATATDLASTTQPYSNTTFAGGPRGDGGAIGSTVPLVEVLGPASTGETSCSAAANRITELAVLRGLQPSQRPVFAFTAGKGSTRLDEISKGTAWYNGQITNMITSAKALNPSCAIHYVELMTGINNAAQGTLYGPFLATAEQLQVDLQQLVQSQTGQTDPVYFLCHQPSYFAATHPDMAYALLDLEKNNPMFFMLDPSYNLPGQNDQTHFPAPGSAWMGLRTARAADQIVMDGKKPNGIRPVSATFDGTRVRLRCKVPTPPLVLDTLTMLPTTDMGFRLVDASGTVPISSIVIENGTDVLLTPGRPMTGTRTLRYAADYLAAGILIKDGASGNLRDSTPGFRVINGVTCYLYRICPHFPPMTIVNAGA